MTLSYGRTGGATLAGVVCLSVALLASSVVPASPAPHRSRHSVSKAVSTKHPAAYSPQASKARNAKLSRARVAARVRMVRDTPIPRYKTDASGALVPDVHAAAAIIYNPETHQVLWEENSQDKRSIASITKVMTAVVFVESDPDMSQVVTVERSDAFAASTTHLRAGYQISVHDLLHLLLISSDNAAARALARISPWGPAGFVARMNEKAGELGLQSTTYADPSGLDSSNMSSAYDMARLIAYAASDERISEIMRKPEYTLTLGRRPITVHSTNQLLTRSEMEGSVVGGKTGFIARSGYCLATLLRVPQLNQQVAVVVLGARSNAGRFNETRNLWGWLSSKTHDMFGKKETPQE
ncbi:MAG TPA: serine hydrolase [Vicinamibacterales bacterium]|jgi:D-alanyl-D-alanine endopeptidase (penicillin-binding protein 7)